MRTAIFPFYFAISLLLVSSVCGQVTTIDHDRLDSILLTGHPKAAMSYWSTVCHAATGDSPATPCLTTTELLQDLLDFVALFEEKKPAYTRQAIANGRTQSERYHETYAGSSATRAYQLFLAAADSEDWLQAIIYLRTARLFKILFVKKTLADAHQDYVQAKDYFTEGEYDAADSTLNSIRFDASNHPTLLAYADTISYLQQRVDRKLLEIEKRHYYWERTASVERRFCLSLTGQLTNQPGSNAFPLVMSNANATIQVDVTRVPPTFRPGLGLQAWYRLNKRTSVGVGVFAAKFVYSSVHTPQLIFFEFDVAHTRFFVGGQYMFRSAVGLRPYLSLGLGVMRYKYDQIECVVLLEPSDPSLAPIPEIYHVDAETFTSSETVITYGVQFVPRPDSRWAVTSEISWYRPFKEHAYLPLPRLAIGLRIDLLM